MPFHSATPLPARCKEIRRLGYDPEDGDETEYDLRAVFACWRCGYLLGSALRCRPWPPYADRWVFLLPPGFKLFDDDPADPNARRVIRPTKKRREQRLELRRKADTDSFAKLKLRYGSEAWIPYRDPLRYGDGGKYARVSLPALMECERCGAINTIEPPKVDSA